MPARMSFAIPSRMVAVEGPIGIPVGLDFSTVNTVTGDLTLEMSSGTIGFVQSVWIDNSKNTKALSIVFPGTGQILTVKANTQGYYPIIPFQGSFSWSATSIGAAVVVPVIFTNVQFEASQWATV